jgi:non-ribosomal peptide synthetase component F
VRRDASHSLCLVRLLAERAEPTPCWEVLQRVRAIIVAAYAHQDLPFEHLVQTLEHERGLKRSAFCQVILILQSAMLRPLQRSARMLSFLETDLCLLLPPLVATTIDVILFLRERPPGLTVSAIDTRGKNVCPNTTAQNSARYLWTHQCLTWRRPSFMLRG